MKEIQILENAMLTWMLYPVMKSEANKVLWAGYEYTGGWLQK